MGGGDRLSAVAGCVAGGARNEAPGPPVRVARPVVSPD